ncbi:MAG: hypothetical protein PHE84_00335 [bacterium]|nr:hypothetical protein [bacterium]
MMNWGFFIVIGVIFLLCTVFTIISFVFYLKIKKEVDKTKEEDD